MRFGANFGAAVHTLLIIQDLSQKQKVTSDVIAEMLGTSPVLVRNLLKMLKDAGLISVAPNNSKKGTTMLRPLSDITIDDVFKAVERKYVNELVEPTTRLGNRSHSGILTNEILTEIIEIGVESFVEAFSKITLADILTKLEEKESPYENPSALLPKK